MVDTNKLNETLDNVTKDFTKPGKDYFKKFSGFQKIAVGLAEAGLLDEFEKHLGNKLNVDSKNDYINTMTDSNSYGMIANSKFKEMAKQKNPVDWKNQVESVLRFQYILDKFNYLEPGVQAALADKLEKFSNKDFIKEVETNQSKLTKVGLNTRPKKYLKDKNYLNFSQAIMTKVGKGDIKAQEQTLVQQSEPSALTPPPVEQISGSESTKVFGDGSDQPLSNVSSQNASPTAKRPDVKPVVPNSGSDQRLSKVSSTQPSPASDRPRTAPAVPRDNFLKVLFRLIRDLIKGRNSKSTLGAELKNKGGAPNKPQAITPVAVAQYAKPPPMAEVVSNTELNTLQKGNNNSLDATKKVASNINNRAVPPVAKEVKINRAVPTGRP